MCAVMYDCFDIVEISLQYCYDSYRIFIRYLLDIEKTAFCLCAGHGFCHMTSRILHGCGWFGEAWNGIGGLRCVWCELARVFGLGFGM